MRKQYHFRPSADGLVAWDVDRLVKLSDGFAQVEVPLNSIRELDEPFWFSGGSKDATPRAIAEHARLINEADLSYPIILSAEGRVMDGMHRVAKAALLGRATVLAVQFATTPEPDFVGVTPEELSYEESAPESSRVT